MASSDEQTIVPLPPLPAGDGCVNLPERSGTSAERVAGDTGQTGAVIGKAISEAIFKILEDIEKDDEGRRKFTQGIVAILEQTFPQYNWICVHGSHDKSFDGKEGDDWGYGHADFDRKVGGRVGYEIYYCRSGIFSLHGDGGYLNWAWIGYLKGKSGDGRILMFRSP